MKKLLTLSLLAAITLMTVSCGDKEEDLNCTSNTQALYDGTNLCGVAVLSKYESYKEYPDGNYREEYFAIGFTVGHPSWSTAISGAIYIRLERELKEGDSFTYSSIDNPSLDQELLLTLGLEGNPDLGIHVSHFYGTLEVLKLDRDQNLITLSFDITGEYNTGESNNMSGTITDFYFE